MRGHFSGHFSPFADFTKKVLQNVSLLGKICLYRKSFNPYLMSKVFVKIVYWDLGGKMSIHRCIAYMPACVPIFPLDTFFDLRSYSSCWCCTVWKKAFLAGKNRLYLQKLLLFLFLQGAYTKEQIPTIYRLSSLHQIISLWRPKQDKVQFFLKKG